jgi:ribonuclease T1
MTIACLHSSKRVPASQSLSAIRLLAATLTHFKTPCYGLAPTSCSAKDRAMNRRWIVSLLVFWSLLASLPLGQWNGPSATWLIERAEALESASPATAAPQKAQDLLAQLQARHGNPLPGYIGGREFHNREHRLPPGHYHEYDVNPKIRGRSRDAERIVVEQGTGRAYYSGDHYRTFTPLDTTP